MNEHTLTGCFPQIGRMPTNPCGRVAPAPQSLLEGPCDHFANAPRVLSSPLSCPSLLCRALVLIFSPRLHDSLTLLSLLFEPCPQGTASRNGQSFLAHHLETALCISRQASLSLGWADDPSDKIKMCSLHSTPSFTGEW